jgi:hypothetical protein
MLLQHLHSRHPWRSDSSYKFLISAAEFRLEPVLTGDEMPLAMGVNLSTTSDRHETVIFIRFLWL